MEGIYQHYIIDLSSNNNFVQIPVAQGDGNEVRQIEIELIQNSVPYEIDKADTVITIMGTKPDTKQIVNPCTLTSEGYILVDITSQMSAVPGRGDYQIVLFSKSKNSQLKSFPFIIITTAVTFDVSYIVSTDEFQLLTKNIVNVENAYAEAQRISEELTQLEETISDAESIRVDAENKRLDAETERNNAEITRISNEEERQEFYTQAKIDEQIRQENEETRIQQASNFAEAEVQRVENELERQEQAQDFFVAEEERKTNEVTRHSNEEERIEAENERTAQFTESIGKANDATTLANIATQNAEIAATKANEIYDDLIAKRDAGYFNGENGVITTLESGQYAFKVVGDDLYLFYAEGEQAPTNFSINEDGYLIYTIA